MPKVNPHNGTEAKPDIFSQEIFKYDITFLWLQNTKLFQ